MGQPLTDIPVFYSEHLLADAQSFSPSAAKPRQVLSAWQHAGLPISVHPITPASPMDLCLAHDPRFVHGVLNGTIPNGFGNTLPAVARSLPYTTGAMVSAAGMALHLGCACAPVSGFHHAHYDSAGGYCTFNGLVVAAQKLLGEGAVQQVLILDCDMHFGDGTEEILGRLGLTRSVGNATFGRWYSTPSDADAYLHRLRETAAGFDAYDIVLYQAGADVHVDDPLGGVLTAAQMRERDRIVFEAAFSSETPIAWNLAGGYQEPLSKVVDLHVGTLRECARAFCPAGGW